MDFSQVTNHLHITYITDLLKFVIFQLFQISKQKTKKKKRFISLHLKRNTSSSQNNIFRKLLQFR